VVCFWGEFGASCKVERVHLGVWQDFFSLLGWLFASQTEKKKKKKKEVLVLGFLFFCFTLCGSVVISLQCCYAYEVNCIPGRLSAGEKSSPEIGCPGLGFIAEIMGKKKRAAERRQSGGSELLV